MDRKKSDRSIKSKATKRESIRVYENMEAPKDIIAHCSDGVYERRLNTSPGKFWYGPWKRVS